MTGDRPSSTALLIAAATVYAVDDTVLAPLVAPGAAELSAAMLALDGVGRRWLRIAASPLGRRLFRAAETFTLPGIGVHYQLRKRFISAGVEQVLVDGCRRLVVLGAGLDTLGLRLAGANRCAVVEIDHPATQAIKQRLIAARPTRSIALLPCDLATEPLPELASSSATVVVAEGLLMYLEPARVERLFQQLRAIGPGVRMVFSFMDRPRVGPAGFRPRSRLTEFWLRRRGEPFRWDLPSDELGEWLRSRGFQLVQKRSMQQLRDEAGIGQIARLEGEHVAIAIASD